MPAERFAAAAGLLPFRVGGAVAKMGEYLNLDTLPLQVEILHNEFNSAAAFAVASLLALLALLVFKYCSNQRRLRRRRDRVIARLLVQKHLRAEQVAVVTQDDDYGEAGYAGVVTPADEAALVNGCLNVMGYLKMIARPVRMAKRRPPRKRQPSANSGMFPTNTITPIGHPV